MKNESYCFDIWYVSLQQRCGTARPSSKNINVARPYIKSSNFFLKWATPAHDYVYQCYLWLLQHEFQSWYTFIILQDKLTKLHDLYLPKTNIHLVTMRERPANPCKTSPNELCRNSKECRNEGLCITDKKFNRKNEGYRKQPFALQQATSNCKIHNNTNANRHEFFIEINIIHDSPNLIDCSITAA